jgi:hypothetical protein
MVRRSEAGQLMIETAVLALLFVSFFFIAIAISENGERVRAQYRFSPPRSTR